MYKRFSLNFGQNLEYMCNLNIDNIFAIQDRYQFNDIAIKIFNYQAKHNPVYKAYLSYLKFNPTSVSELKQIPFLPIEFFKTHKIICGNKKIQKTFFSSGTTGMQRSNHHITDISVYEKSFSLAFEMKYGNIQNYCILALLPTYLENESSSLVYMVNHLIKQSGHNDSGFYLDNLDQLAKKLKTLDEDNHKVILIGVSYALIDLAKNYPMNLQNTVIMETGGMKGKRKELTKAELHQFLASKLGVKNIHSEYGMTELLSQAYSEQKGRFSTPPWMKILIRDTYDPFTFLEKGKSGGINIIDLANVNSCSFIETKDLGKIYNDNTFEILGRLDNSDIRGCNLLVAD